MKSNIMHNMVIVALIFITTILSVLGYGIYAALTIGFYVMVGTLIVKNPKLILHVTFLTIVISAIAPNFI